MAFGIKLSQRMQEKKETSFGISTIGKLLCPRVVTIVHSWSHGPGWARRSGRGQQAGRCWRHRSVRHRPQHSQQQSSNNTTACDHGRLQHHRIGNQLLIDSPTDTSSSHRRQIYQLSALI